MGYWVMMGPLARAFCMHSAMNMLIGTTMRADQKAVRIRSLKSTSLLTWRFS